MKLSNIAKKCKAEKYVCIIDRGDSQFVGTKKAIYKLPRLPYISEADIPVLFGISDKAWTDTYNSDHAPASWLPVSLSDLNGDEIAVQGATLYIDHELAIAFTGEHSREMIFVEEWYLIGIDVTECEFHIRRTRNDTPVLFVTRGMLTEAVIFPMPVSPRALAEKLHNLSQLVMMRCSNYESVDDTFQLSIDESADDEETETENE